VTELPYRRKEIIGDCTLYLGDCRDVAPELVDVCHVVTSPPYGQQRDYGQKISDWRALVSDCLTSIPYSPVSQVLVNLGLIHRDGRVIRYWDSLIEDMEASGLRLFGWYVWDQLSGMAGDWNGRLAPSFEFVFHFNANAVAVNKTKTTKGGKIHGPGLVSKSGLAAAKKTHDGASVQPFKIPDSVIRTARETQGGIAESQHPARFPVSFARELIEPFSLPSETILDPFMGVASTGVACVKLGRKFIGIEIDEGYFNIACERIRKAYAQPDMFIAPPAPKPKQEAMI
jgi:DNA modification methylase